MLSALVSRLPDIVRRQIEHRIILLRAADNTGWIIANSVLRLLIAMLVGIWVARYLGVAQFGLYNYAVSINLLLRSVIPLGTGSLTMRDLARSRDDRNTILGSAFGIQLSMSVVTLLVAIAIALFAQGNDPLSQRFTLILSVTLLLTPLELIIPWFQSQLQAEKVLITNTTSLLLMAAARIWLVTQEASLEAFIYLIIAEKAVNIATSVYLYYRSGEALHHWHFKPERAWNTVVEAMPLFWSELARNFYGRASEIMLKALAGATAVGYYSAANRIADLYLLVPVAILASATPIISKSKTQERLGYLTQLTNLIRVTSVLGICSTIVVSQIAQWLMPWIYGEEFAGAGDVLAINIWSAIPVSLGLITGLWVINEGLARVHLEKVLLMVTMVVVLNWLLIPLYGAPGAAMSMLVASTVVYIIWDFVDPRMRNFGLLKLHAFMPWWFGLKDL